MVAVPVGRLFLLMAKLLLTALSTVPKASV
jgi:hypothetical protein